MKKLNSGRRKYLVMMAAVLLLTTLATVVWSCGSGTDKGDDDFLCLCGEPTATVAEIYLVPLDGTPKSRVEALKDSLEKNLNAISAAKEADPKKNGLPYVYIVNVLPHANTPDSCLNNIKSRYRANKILRSLRKAYAKEIKRGYYIIGVTDRDISTTAHGVDDYGIQGLTGMPGKVSIISSFRVKDKRMLWRLAAHEYCHGEFEMAHCEKKDPKCLMKDAEGGNPHLELKKTFCSQCMDKFSVPRD